MAKFCDAFPHIWAAICPELTRIGCRPHDTARVTEFSIAELKRLTLVNEEFRVMSDDQRVRVFYGDNEGRGYPDIERLFPIASAWAVAFSEGLDSRLVIHRG